MRERDTRERHERETPERGGGRETPARETPEVDTRGRRREVEFVDRPNTYTDFSLNITSHFLLLTS